MKDFPYLPKLQSLTQKKSNFASEKAKLSCLAGWLSFALPRAKLLFFCVKDCSVLFQATSVLLWKTSRRTLYNSHFLRRTLVALRRTLVTWRRTLVAWRRTLVASRRTLVALRRTLVASRRTLVALRRTLVASRRTLVASRRTLVASRGKCERLDFWEWIKLDSWKWIKLDHFFPKSLISCTHQKGVYPTFPRVGLPGVATLKYVTPQDFTFQA